MQVDLPDDPAFQLDRGSLDFFIRVDALPPVGSEWGLVARDALGRLEPGHLKVTLEGDGDIDARIQNQDGSFMRCADGDPVRFGEWMHIGVQFGPPDFALYVDGVRQESSRPACSEPTDIGIDGNENPWVFGAENGESADGGNDFQNPFQGGIDEVRLSRIRRNFDAYRRP